jgi:excisionase family DNA binding protein
MTVETRTERVEAGRLLLRPEEVARALGVGRTTVFELIRVGELRSVKIGKSRRIPTEAVREYVAGLGG